MNNSKENGKPDFWKSKDTSPNPEPEYMNNRDYVSGWWEAYEEYLEMTYCDDTNGLMKDLNGYKD